MKEHKICCHNCGRYLGTAVGTVVFQEMPCGGCGAKVNIKVVSADSSEADITKQFTVEETEPKRTKDKTL